MINKLVDAGCISLEIYNEKPQKMRVARRCESLQHYVDNISLED